MNALLNQPFKAALLPILCSAHSSLSRRRIQTRKYLRDLGWPSGASGCHVHPQLALTRSGGTVHAPPANEPQ